MIKANMKFKDGKQLICEIRGHANSNRQGHDIICASVSMLTYALAQVIKDMENAGLLKKPAKIFLIEGAAYISCVPRSEHIPLARTYYHMVKRGVELLCANYSEYVQLEADNI